MSNTTSAATSAAASCSSSTKQNKQKLRITIVGSGVSTAIPVISHTTVEGPDCACANAMKDPASKDNRNNVSILIQEWVDHVEEITQPHYRYPAPKPEELEKEKKQQEEKEKEKEKEKKEDEKKTPGWSKSVLVDLGKTFRASFFKVLAPLKLKQIDALLLTHEHMDAIGGVDDIRDIQKFETVPPHWHWRITEGCPCYCSPFTLKTLNKGFDYIIKNSRIHPGYVSKEIPGFNFKGDPALRPPPPTTTSEQKQQAQQEGKEEERNPYVSPLVPHGGSVLHPASPWESRVVPRRIAALDVRLMDEDNGPFEISLPPAGIQGRWFGLPVEHGAAYTCVGYAFGAHDGTKTVYLSDVSRVPEEVMQFLKSDLIQPVELLIVDGLLPLNEDKHFSHFTLDQAWELTKEIQPRKSYAVGMWCAIKHDETQAQLAQLLQKYKQEENKECRIEEFALAYDGQEIILE